MGSVIAGARHVLWGRRQAARREAQERLLFFEQTPAPYEVADDQVALPAEDPQPEVVPAAVLFPPGCAEPPPRVGAAPPPVH